MIGSRTLLGVIVILLLGATFGQRPADPAVADPLRALAVERRVAAEAERSEAALAELGAELATALDEARGGAAAVMAGDDPPGARLEAAARRLEDAERALVNAQVALERLRGMLGATRHPGSGPRLGLSSGELRSIAAQLEGSAASADGFAAMRHSTEEALAALEQALIALGDQDPAEALAAASDASRRLGEVGRWEQVLPTMPLWLDTAGELIDALQDLARAQLDGDEAAATAAARAYEVAAAEVRRADQALAVAFADGGAAIAQAPLQQLAAALTLTEDARSEVASLVHLLAVGHERHHEG